MSQADRAADAPSGRAFQIVDLNYLSLYVHEYHEAVSFYSRVFGPPESVADDKTNHGWRMGATWLTVLPGDAGPTPYENPRNAEFAIQVADRSDVDLLYDTLIGAGAKSCMAPQDTSMYEPMRFACVDDPFGVRIDVYCRLETQSDQ